MYDPMVIAETRVQMIKEILERATNEDSGLYDDGIKTAEVLGREAYAYWLLEVVGDSFMEPDVIIENLKELLSDESNYEPESSDEEETEHTRVFNASSVAFAEEILALAKLPLPETEEEATNELLTNRLKAVKAITDRIINHTVSEWDSDYAIGVDEAAQPVAEHVANILGASTGEDVRATVLEIHSHLGFARSMSNEIGYNAVNEKEVGVSEGYAVMAQEFYRALPLAY